MAIHRIYLNPRDPHFIIPAGYLSARNLADLAGCTLGTVHNRCKAAGVPPLRIPRTNKDGVNLGGKRVLVYPKEEALDAVLKD